MKGGGPGEQEERSETRRGKAKGSLTLGEQWPGTVGKGGIRCSHTVPAAV